MLPEEKAKELFDKYFELVDNTHAWYDTGLQAKQGAIIAVAEIMANPLMTNSGANDETDLEWWAYVIVAIAEIKNY